MIKIMSSKKYEQLLSEQKFLESCIDESNDTARALSQELRIMRTALYSATAMIWIAVAIMYIRKIAKI
jgi:hypothetical protein